MVCLHIVLIMAAVIHLMMIKRYWKAF